MIAMNRQENPGFLTFIHGAAWFFIVASLGHLVWVFGQKVSDPGGALTLYDTFSYHGVFGVLQVLLQMGVVVAAAVMSVLPRTRPRRLGHVLLCGWAAWWASRLAWGVGDGVSFDAVSQAVMTTAFLGCTVTRAVFGWTPRPASAGPGLPDAPVMESDARRSASWTDLRTEEAPATRLALHLRDVPPSRSLAEVDLTSRGDRVRAAVSKAGKSVKRAAGAAPVRRAGRVLRDGVAKTLKRVSEVTGRGAERLAPAKEPAGETPAVDPPVEPQDAPGPGETVDRHVA